MFSPHPEPTKREGFSLRASIKPLWETKIEIGDSLSKKRGSYKLEIYKENGKKVIMDYRNISTK
jgi:hypothetical protein